MLIDDLLKQSSNSVAEGTYIINDVKLKPFAEKEGHFLTFTLQDKTGVIWGKIWDQAEKIAQHLKNDDVVTLIGRTNIYNSKTQIIVDKIKIAETYDLADLTVVSKTDPDVMFKELIEIMNSISDPILLSLWKLYLEDEKFISAFKECPGGKGTVHHAYLYGLLEHELTVLKFLQSFRPFLSSLKINFDKVFMGGFLHDLGKLEAYSYKFSISMTNIGRLHEHTTLGYYSFRKKVDELKISEDKKQELIEELGHIILSHHGAREQHSVIVPMTLEAKLVAFGDALDSSIAYMSQQIESNADETGWIFDSLMDQYFYRKPETEPKPIIRRKQSKV